MAGTLSELREALNAAMAAVIASSGSLALAACGDAGIGSGIEDDPGFVPMDCASGAQSWLPGLTPGIPAEYLELRVLHGIDGDTLETRGVLCAGAGDPATCAASFSALNGGTFPFGYGSQVSRQAQLAATRGDDALLLGTHEALVSFLQPIDTPADAMLVVHTAGRDVACERGGAKPSAGGFDVQAFSYPGCGGRTRQLVHVDAAGNIAPVGSVVENEPERGCVPGRRPIGLRPASCHPSLRSAGGYFARAARLEAASVYAFQRLGSELRLHGAPPSLLRAARRAERDEIRHARSVSRLARAFGAAPKAARVERLPLRDLESVALENVAEGCVRETFGALVARWQSRHAASVKVRRIYARIAEDELRHAALAWRIAAWAESGLSRRARQQIQAAERETVSALHRELAVEPSAELVEHAGIPRAAQALALAEHVTSSLWRTPLRL